MLYNSKVNSVPFMSVSNSENMILSEKDLNAVDFNFLVKPATLEFKHELNCQNNIANTATSTNSTNSQVEDHHHHHQDQDQDQDKFETMLVSTSKLKIPSSTSVEEGFGSSSDPESSGVRHRDDDDKDEDNDGFKTPTSLDRKIPAVLKCPAAPRKAKYLSSSSSMKRKPAARRRILLDLSAEIESLFPPTVLADLIAGKISKFRQGNDSTTTVLL